MARSMQEKARRRYRQQEGLVLTEAAKASGPRGRGRVHGTVKYIVVPARRGRFFGDRRHHQENICKAAGKEEYWLTSRIRPSSWSGSGLPPAGSGRPPEQKQAEQERDRLHSLEVGAR